MMHFHFIHGLMFGLKVEDTFVSYADTDDPPDIRTLLVLSFLCFELDIIY